MGGSKIGGRKARETNLARDPNYYRNLGKKGAEAYSAQPKHLRKPRGFAYDPKLASRVGKIGGRISRRT